MLHLVKLAAGVKDLAHLQALQDSRPNPDAPVRHRTRNTPKRAGELLDGGSLYWVVAGGVRARQRLLAVEDAAARDGSAGAVLVLDPVLVPVAHRPTRAFQGWRYLRPEEAPPDLGTGDPAAPGLAEMPEAMRAELRRLALI